MDKNIKVYDVTIDSDVFAISLVEDPAIEENFVYLSKEKPLQVCLEQDEKHMVIGPVLIPNKPIYRRNGEEEFYIQFSEKTIEQLAYNYLKEDYQHNVTEQHLSDAENITVVESWIKTSENDKSMQFESMKSLPVGTWFVAMKVDNEDVWQRIKSEEMKGFSIEAFVNLDEIKLQKEKENNMVKENFEQVEVNDSFWDKIKTIIKEALTNPAIKESEAEVVADDAVEDVKDEVVEEPAKEKVEEMAEEPEAVEPEAEDSEEVKALKEEIEALKKENEELKAKLAEKEGEVEKLSKQPSAKPVKVEAKKENEISFLDFAAGNVKF